MTIARGSFEDLTPGALEARLREVADRFAGAAAFDDLDVRHLLDLLTRRTPLLRRDYDQGTLDRVLSGDPRPAAWLLPAGPPNDATREAAALRVWSVPEALRSCGDKCLYDVGVAGRTVYRGLPLQEIGPRSYDLAGQVLSLLADDRMLREHFERNRIGRLPLDEEVLFLRQCASRFDLYARILQAWRESESEDVPSAVVEDRVAVPATPVPPAVASGALAPVPSRRARTGRGSERGARRPAPEPRPRPAAVPVEEEGPDTDRDTRLARFERTLLLRTLDLEKLRQDLGEDVVDQEEAVHRLCDDLSVFAAGMRDRQRPLSYFLVGPTGVGKNHLMESLARRLEAAWECEVPTLILEGPQYAYPSDVNELKGATRGFIRSDEEGLLAEFHDRARRAPLSVLLVDEVEKAHPQLMRFFLSLMDRGSTMDNRGRVLRFPATLLAFTSNAGYSEIEMRQAPIGYAAGGSGRRRDAARALRRGLAPEFLARLQVIHFRPLGRASAGRILELEIGRLAERFQKRHGVRLEVRPAARQALLAQGFTPEEGARNLVGRVDRVCNVEVQIRLRPAGLPMNDARRRLIRLIREARRGERAVDLDALSGMVEAELRPERSGRRLVVDYRRDRFVYHEGAA
ncbi:MAG TPA: AAA family ATPase [Candidatus Polarisedimenticolia bacterium]|nr:AAA family ATPase [Candidatus Polarisedimenticolia bacterium]